MTDRMRPIPFEPLLRWILIELDRNDEILGIPRPLFYRPRADAPHRVESLFGRPLDAPVGPAAGPHTQLAQNIVAAWLSGGRFIELKTVQILDDLDIPRPCIDLADEGYNVEWSQELPLDASRLEYVKAWALVHVLRRRLGHEDVPFGTIFNMSIGYDLEGIRSLAMTRFMDRLADAHEDLDPIRDALRRRFPEYADVEIPDRITDNVTLSTMHGCPPDEIERIARYLIEERGLHTAVKLNPTLLGADRVRGILADTLGYREIEIPDRVFEHDLDWNRALSLIESLRGAAAARGRTFGIKLSNTLAVANHRGTLPGDEMYMSGRSLYPITVSLFHALRSAIGDDLPVSFSAGVDALNVAGLLAAGALPVTVASDLLKPGGYSRLLQYIERIDRAIEETGAATLAEYIRRPIARLAEAADRALADPRYRKDYHLYDLPKVDAPLEPFDCIAAPCIAQCAVEQDVPEYAAWIARGDPDRALAAILHRNPLPAITGHVCTQRCITRCTRNNTDEPVRIRALKRFAVERGDAALAAREPTDRRVIVVGSGPAGLSAAFYLAMSGIDVTIREAKGRAGGMPALAPAFRLPADAVRSDVDRIRRLGVTIVLSSPVRLPPTDWLERGYDAVFLACGFARDAEWGIDGADAAGVCGALDFLERVAVGEPPELGRQIVVVGGGNTAIDAARTARRLTGEAVRLVYRRGRVDMPADREEVDDLLAEGNELIERTAPERVIVEDGRAVALDCVATEPGPPGPDGRSRPIPIPNRRVRIPADTVISAIGQRPDLSFLEGEPIRLSRNGRIDVDASTCAARAAPVYAGGDVVRGPAIIVEACADGRRAAEAICEQLGVPFRRPLLPTLDREETFIELKRARARRTSANVPDRRPPHDRMDFDLVEQVLPAEQAAMEAERCLQCSILCDKCIEVCPNRANVAVAVDPIEAFAPRFAVRGDRLDEIGTEIVSIRQSRQIVHIDDLCNECGNCATFCVHPGEPFRDKPRLFLDRTAFDTEVDNAYFVEPGALLARRGGATLRVTAHEDGFIFDDAVIRARLDADLRVVSAERVGPIRGEVSLRPAIELAVIHRGIHRSARYLPGVAQADTV